MNESPIAPRVTTSAPEDELIATRRGIIERLADPYLTEHDRWVLRQFARFLGGMTPEPDLRAIRVRIERPLHVRARWTKV
jgi:hypothetical protein